MNYTLSKTKKYINLLVSASSGLMLGFIVFKIIKNYLYWQNPKNIELQEMFPVMHFCNNGQLTYFLIIILSVFLASIFFVFFLKNSNKKNILVIIIDILLFAVLLRAIYLLYMISCI